ncbi:MAG: GNAT family N-acetyltransferase [Candidatus Bathyarchaeia archaeon]
MKAPEEITIHELKEHEENKWNDVVNKSEDAWIYHRIEFRSINSAYNTKWKPYYFIALDRNEEIIGVFPTFLCGKRLYSLPMGACGPCCKDQVDKQAIRSVFMHHIDQFCRERHVEAAYIELPTLAPCYLPPNEREILWPTFFGYEEWKPHYTYIVNLESLDILWGKLEKRARNAVRKASKSGLKLTMAQSLSDLKDYYLLHIQTYERTGAKPHPSEYFETIWKMLFPQNMAQIFFAEYNGKRIAAVFILMYKGAAIYNSGASATEYLKYEPNAFLQWEVIKFLVQNKFKVYDLGGADPLSKDPKMQSLNMFKRQWGGVLVKGFKGWKEYSLKRKMLKKAFQARELVKRFF